MCTVKDIREQFKALYGSSMFNASGLLEIVGASFIADEESIFGKVDYAYVDKDGNPGKIFKTSNPHIMNFSYDDIFLLFV